MDKTEKFFLEEIKKYGLTDEDFRDIVTFMQIKDTERSDPKLEKRVTKIFSKKLGIKPFKDEPIPKEFSAVLPLFREHVGTLDQFASGVLIEIGNKIFLFSASHALEQMNEVLMPVGTEIVSIVGGCGGIYSDSKEHANLDFLFIDIAEKLHEKIKNNSVVLNYSNIGFEYDLPTNAPCVFVGYPFRKSKKDRENNSFSSEILEYVGTYMSNEETYHKLGYKKNENIIMRYNFKQTTNRLGENVRPTVLPEGISGGGIFINSIRKKNEDSVRNVKLIGISHSFDSKKKVMIGTRIETCLAIIQSFNL